MKMLITAALLTIAAPALAQADPHAGHKRGQHESHQGGQDEGRKMGCCDDADRNGKMDCCETMKDGKAMGCCEEDSAKPDAHESHGKH